MSHEAAKNDVPGDLVAAQTHETGKLLARIAELESALAEAKRARSEREYLLEAVLDRSPSVIFVKSAVDRRYLLVNRTAREGFRKSREELIGAQDSDFFSPEAALAMRAKDDEALLRDELIRFEEIVPHEGGALHSLTVKFPVRGPSGEVVGVCGIATDITEQKRNEAEQIALKEQVIAAKDEALRELSSPIVPIADGVLAMPLVGAIDDRRAEQIMQTLLEGIGAQMAHTVILDITGVRTIDATAASALVSSARAATLVGAGVVLTGIRPEVARTLIELGVDLGGIITRGTLQGGIAYALSQRR